MRASVGRLHACVGSLSHTPRPPSAPVAVGGQLRTPAHWSPLHEAL